MDSISKGPIQDIRKLGEMLMKRTSEKEYYRFLHIEEQCRLKWQTTIDKFDKLMREHERCKQIKTQLENELQRVSMMWDKEKEARLIAETRCVFLINKLEQTYDILRYDRDVEQVQVKTRAKATNGGRTTSENSDEITSTGSFLSNLSAISGTETENDFRGTSAGILNDSFHVDSLDSMDSDEMDQMLTNLSGPANRSLLEKTFQVTSNPDKIYIDAGDYGISSYDAGNLLAQNTLKRSIKNLHVSDNFTKANSTVACRKQSIKEETPSDKNNSDPIYEKIDGDCYSDDENKENSKMVNGTNVRPTSTCSLLHPNDLALKNLDKLINCQHAFSRRTASRSIVCLHCSKKFLFGLLAYKCSKCKEFIHHDCKSQLKSSTKGQKSGKAMNTLNISDFVPLYGPGVPGLIMHCVNEVETRGLSERGIYRVSGSEREIKALKERFVYEDFPDLSAVDMHVICGCIKIFLRGLSEPLIPTRQWKVFARIVSDFDGDYLAGNIMRNLQIEIERLPQANRDTLAFIVLHLQRVATCPAVQMPISNLAKIFGPTVVGYSQKVPDHTTILSETVIQQSVMEHFLNIPTDYWFSFITTNISFDA